MNKGHKIVADYLTNYIHYNNLDKLTEVLSKGKTFRRGEKYLFNIEKQIEIVGLFVSRKFQSAYLCVSHILDQHVRGA